MRLSTEQIKSALIEAASRAMDGTSATNPVDLATFASLAIESAGETIDIVQKMGRPKA